MKPPGPYTLQRAVTAARKLRELLGEDIEGYKLAIESETDILELADRIIEQSITDGILAEAASLRARRLNRRKEALRATAIDLLESARLGRDDPLERPAYTASINDRQHAIVTDFAKLPKEFINQTVDTRSLTAALKRGPVEGATLSNPEPAITITTK